MSKKSENKINTSTPRVAVKSNSDVKTTRNNNNREPVQGFIHKESSPTLPGPMNYMLNDDKGLDKDLVAIEVTFFRNKVTRTLFVVSTPDGLNKFDPLEYDSFKNEKKLHNARINKEESIAGAIKKLAQRCLIFVDKDVSQGKVEAFLADPGMPDLIKNTMKMTQKEFALKLPSEEKIIGFWLGLGEAKIKALSEYTQKVFGIDFEKNLNDIREARDARLAAKAAKMATLLESKTASKNVNPKGGVEPPVATESTVKQIIKDKSAKTTTKPNIGVSIPIKEPIKPGVSPSAKGCVRIIEFVNEKDKYPDDKSIDSGLRSFFRENLLTMDQTLDVMGFISRYRMLDSKVNREDIQLELPFLVWANEEDEEVSNGSGVNPVKEEVISEKAKESSPD